MTPQKDQVYMLTWFIFKPGVETKDKSQAIAFLLEGAKLVSLGGPAVLDPSMYDEPAFRFAIESNGENEEKVGVKTFESDDYQHIKDVVVLINSKALDKHFQKQRSMP